MDIKAKPKDRQSGTGVSGSPKKGGGGGKGTWGIGGLDDLKAVSVSGPRDPNYDSEDETNEDIVISKTEVNSPIQVLIQEFLTSGDVNESIKSLKELKIGAQHDQFVKKCILSAMERKAEERELVSKLLSSIYNIAVIPEKLAEGFQAALDDLEDVVLDTPDAVGMLSKFLARAIIDEVVPPAFLKHAIAKSELAEQCIQLANSLLNQPFRSERLAHVWGAGDLSSVKRLKEEVTLTLKEFLINNDFNEVDRSIRELNAHAFHPQVVKQTIREALTKDEAERKKLMSLLAFLSQSDLISKDHMKKGFNYCCEAIDDLKLDVLNAPTILIGFIRTAKSEDWLDSNFEEPKF